MRSWFVIIWLLIVPLFLFLPVWLRGEVFGTFDLGHMTIALEDLFARYQRTGQIPVWAPEFHGGFPLMANAFQSFFYLPHFLLRTFLPGVWVVNFSLLAHLWLAGWGMYLWLRIHRLPKIAAVAGGLIFMVGGYFIGRITLPHLFFPATWIPVAMASLAAAWQKPTWKWLGLTSLAMTGLVFAGHVQMVFYAAIIGIIVLGAEMISSSPRQWGTRWRFLLLPVIVFALTAVHILPAAELISQSRRAEELKDREAFDVSYPVPHLLTWLKPSAFGHQAEYRGAKNEPELMTYFGIVGLLLGIVGLGQRRTWRESLGRSAVALVVVGFALAGGEFSLIFRWLHEHMWLLARFANPGRAIVLVHVGWSLLAAQGMATLLSRLPAKYAARVGYALLAVIAVELLVAGYPVNPTLSISMWRRPKILAYLPARSDAPRVFSHKILEPVPQTDFHPEVGPLLRSGTRLAQSVVPQASGWEAVDVDLTWNGREAQSGEIIVTIEEEDQVVRSVRFSGDTIIKGKPTRISFEPLSESRGRAYVIALASSYAAPQAPRVVIRTNRGHDNFNPTGSLSECREGTCQALASPDWIGGADLSFWLRYQGDPAWLERELLLPLFGESQGQHMIRTHISLQIDRVDRYLFELGARANFDGSRLIAARDLLDRFSVGTVVAAYPEHRALAGLSGMEQVAAVPAGEYYVHAYRNQQAYPRFQLAGGLVHVQSGAEARQTILLGLSREVVTVEGAGADEIPVDIGKEAGRIEVREDRPTELVARVRSSGNQLFVVRDVAYQGWQARLDSVSVPIYTIDSLFRGVVVPTGEHEVRFTYQSKGWRLGSKISGGAWLAVILASCAMFLSHSARKRERKPMKTPSYTASE